jgi:glycosyltransferase involved in cell wall biosynthesis
MLEAPLTESPWPQLSGQDLAIRQYAKLAAPKPLRIAMVSARAFPLMGGIESHIHEVSSRLVSMGHDITVLTTDRTGELPRQERQAGVRTVRVPAWPSNADYYLAPAIYEEIVAGDYDVVHVQGYHTLVAPLAMLASIRKGTPFVVTFHSGGHSSAFRNAIREIQWKTIAPLVRQASMHVGVSVFEADLFSKKMGVPRSRFTVVPNGAQMPVVQPRQASGKKGPSIISIGRLERYKGHQRAIEAMQKLRWRFPDAHLKILGSGPYEGELRRLIKRLRLTEAVTIESIPPAERQNLANLLSAADLVLLLSEYEAHPVAVMEALSLGRKVLTTDTSGFRELSQKGLIRTVSLKSSPIEIAAAMADALEAPPLKTGFTLPNWDDCARQLETVYLAAAQQPF